MPIAEFRFVDLFSSFGYDGTTIATVFRLEINSY